MEPNAPVRLNVALTSADLLPDPSALLQAWTVRPGTSWKCLSLPSCALGARQNRSASPAGKRWPDCARCRAEFPTPPSHCARSSASECHGPAKDRGSRSPSAPAKQVDAAPQTAAEDLPRAEVVAIPSSIRAATPIHMQAGTTKNRSGTASNPMDSQRPTCSRIPDTTSTRHS